MLATYKCRVVTKPVFPDHSLAALFACFLNVHGESCIEVVTRVGVSLCRYESGRQSVDVSLWM